jgi:Right handed beta helix region
MKRRSAVLLAVAFSFAAVAGFAIDLALGDTNTASGCVTASATAPGVTVDGHSVGVDGTEVKTIPGVTVPGSSDVETACVTVTSPPNSTVTVTTGGTTTAPPPPTLGTALPARMPESTGSSGVVISPGANLNSVLTGAVDGEIIELHGGNYPTQFITTKHFSSTNPVTIQSYPGEQAVFTGPTSTPASATNAVYLGDVQGLRIRNVTITAPYSVTGLKIDCGIHVEVDGVTIANTGQSLSSQYGGQGMFLGTGCSGTPANGTRPNDVQLWNSTIKNWNGTGGTSGHAHGLYTAQLDNGVIADNVFYDDSPITSVGWGIQLGGSVTNTKVVNNTLDRIKASAGGYGGGIIVWGTSSYGPLPSGDKIENNLFTNLSEYGVTSSGSAASPLSNYVLNNDAWNNGAGQYNPLYGTNRLFYCTAAGTTACPGDNYAPFDPLYANGAGHDYHLQSGSPARGKGDPAYTPPRDKDGSSRSGAVLGAYG